jgi:hypothetical protein
MGTSNRPSSGSGSLGSLGSSGVMISSPREAKNVPICCWAPRETAPANWRLVGLLRKPCGFLGMLLSFSNARSLR